jgi:hypothetical protein
MSQFLERRMKFIGLVRKFKYNLELLAQAEEDFMIFNAIIEMSIPTLE